VLPVQKLLKKILKQVLKGGSTSDREELDNPWKPLDDYEAPYREPKLPPPGIYFCQF
jgi:hypothetical protein